MKVLKTVPWSEKITCKGCKSELEVEAGDMCTGRYGSFDEFETKFYVICPVCGDWHYFSDSKLPSNVKRDAKRDRS